MMKKRLRFPSTWTVTGDDEEEDEKSITIRRYQRPLDVVKTLRKTRSPGRPRDRGP